MDLCLTVKLLTTADQYKYHKLLHFPLLTKFETHIYTQDEVLWVRLAFDLNDNCVEYSSRNWFFLRNEIGGQRKRETV